MDFLERKEILLSVINFMKSHGWKKKSAWQHSGTMFNDKDI